MCNESEAGTELKVGGFLARIKHLCFFVLLPLQRRDSSSDDLQIIAKVSTSKSLSYYQLLSALVLAKAEGLQTASGRKQGKWMFGLRKEAPRCKLLLLATMHVGL